MELPGDAEDGGAGSRGKAGAWEDGQPRGGGRSRRGRGPLCGANRLSRLETACVLDAGGQARGRAEHGPPLLDTMPWEARSGEWAFLEFDELLREDSGGQVGHDRVRG